MATFDIVFEGGGAKGTAFVGALEVLFGAGHKHRRLVGTSAGAITAPNSRRRPSQRASTRAMPCQSSASARDERWYSGRTKARPSSSAGPSRSRNGRP